MSDTSSNGSSLRRLRSTNPWQSGYPTHSLPREPAHQARILELMNLERRLLHSQVRLQDLTVSGILPPLPPTFDTSRPAAGYDDLELDFVPPNAFTDLNAREHHLDMSGARLSTMPPTATTTQEQGSKRAVVTSVSALPPTTYNEQNASKGSLNTLAYVKVQRALLKHAKTHATDSLSPRQARLWTQAIDPASKKEPKAADALRLCYYMRAQGYDVYAQIKDGSIALYVVNQGSNIRDEQYDPLYWKQNVSTNKIEYTAPSPSRSGHRRNAVSNDTFYMQLDNAQRRAEAHTARRAPGPAAVPNPATATLRAAQARVQAQLDEEEANPM
jgi:hypothetical protein